MLPASGVAGGGAGNGIGIAILDSGITPSDNAEFVGYEWKQSSGTLGTGLFSQTYLSTYNRIKKVIDFTGENRTDDEFRDPPENHHSWAKSFFGLRERPRDS